MGEETTVQPEVQPEVQPKVGAKKVGYTAFEKALILNAKGHFNLKEDQIKKVQVKDRTVYLTLKSGRVLHYEQ
jgi:hypothetical protein